MDAEAGTRFEAGTRKLSDIFFAIFLVWQVSSFAILDSSKLPGAGTRKFTGMGGGGEVWICILMPTSFQCHHLGEKN